MFTAAEFRSMRKNCPEKFENLLQKLEIDQPSFENEDEFTIYESLDRKISERICEILHSEDIISGYVKLLRLGQVDFDFSESEDSLIKKILGAESNIRSGCVAVNDEIPNEPEESEEISEEIIEESVPTIEKIEIPLPNIFEAMYLLRDKNRDSLDGITSSKVKSIKIVVEYETTRFIKKRSMEKPISDDNKIQTDNIVEFSGEELDKIFEILAVINEIEEKI